MIRSSFFISSLIFVAACGGSTAPPGEDGEICEHLTSGKTSNVTATTGSTTNEPCVCASHQRYDVSLVDVTGGRGGDVYYAASSESDYIIALSEDVPLKVTDSSGANVAIESSAASSKDCPEVKGRHVVPLKVGTYRLTFGPTAKASLKIVVEGHAH